jgi:hypothetical protein
MLNKLDMPQVQVLDQQGELLQTKYLTEHGLRIGRQPDNELVLESDLVSRHHVRLDWDGRQVAVTDLDSRNGTLLDGKRLEPQVAQSWPWGETLRVGPYRLQLQPPRSAADGSVVQGPATRLPGQPEPGLQPVPGAERAGGVRIEVGLEATLTLTPGQPAVVKVTLENLGITVDHLTVTVEGVDKDWVQGSPPVVQLNPKASATVTLTIHVPRSPQSLAGDYEVTVRATSRVNPAESGVAHARWTVLPFDATRLDIAPVRDSGRTRGAYTVTIQNDGNASVSYTLSGVDHGQGLTFRFESEQVSVDPGSSVRVTLTVGASLRLVGSTQPHSFNVRAEPAHGPGPKAAGGDGACTTSAQFSHQALLPVWVPPLVLVPLLLLGLLLFHWLTAVPIVDEFTASSSEIKQGESVTIKWRVRNTRTVTINRFGSVPPAAERTDTPDETTTYTLAAANSYGAAQPPPPLTVKVIPPPAPKPQIVSFTASPSSLVAGQVPKIRLMWETESANRVIIEGIGEVAKSGPYEVDAPSTTTTFRLVASNSAGDEDKKTAKVTVKQPSCTVQSASATLYSGPGEQFSVVRSLPKGTPLEPLTRLANGEWIEVDVLGGSSVQGWVKVDPQSISCNVNLQNLPINANPPPPPVP